MTYILTRNQVTSEETQGKKFEDKSNDVNANTTNEAKLKNAVIGLAQM